MQAIDEYVDAVRQLWPHGDPRVASRRAPRSGALSFLVLPDPRRVRMLLPADHVAAASRSVLRTSSALTWSQQAARAALAAALRSGAGRMLSHRIDLGSSEGSLLESLGQDLGDELTCSLTLGTVRANRKPVLNLFDGSGRGAGFVKVGASAATQDAVRHEGEVLQRIGEVGLPPTVLAPTVTLRTTWSGLPTLVLSVLPMPRFTRRTSMSDLPGETMDDLARRFDEGTRTLNETDWWAGLLHRRAQVVDEDQRRRLTAATDRLSDQAAGTPLPIGGWHGDWTPWNMCWHRGRLELWDWERFETGVPVGLDRCHFAVNDAFVSSGLEPGVVTTALGMAGMTPHEKGSREHVVGGAYVSAILDRYLTAGTPVQGRTHDRVRLLLDALDEWVAA